MSKPSLNLVVIRAANLAIALKFYRMLGLEFVEEQHGTGPLHYSCDLGGMVIEIYPGKPGTAPDRRNSGATMLGFEVDSLDAIMAMLREMGALVLTFPEHSSWGRRAIVQDPDGRAIELYQRDSTKSTMP